MNKQAVATVMEQYSRIFLTCRSVHTSSNQGHASLTHQQAQVLAHLDEKEGTSLLHLAQSIGVTPATMFYHVDRLVKKGYVTREQAAEDRREVSLRLTASGTEAMDSQNMLDLERVGALLAQLSGDELDAVLQGFTILGRAADQLPQQGLNRMSAGAETAANTRRVTQTKPTKLKREPKNNEQELEEPEDEEAESLKARASRLTPIHFADTAW
jgi:DNA-binding MarR family transcriptional regulator